MIPHEGKWDNAGIWTEAANRNEPLFAAITDSTPLPDNISKSLINITGTGFEVSSVTVTGNDLLVRFFNAEGDNKPKTISFDCKPDKVELVELNGNSAELLKMTNDKNRRTKINLSMPRFGIRTIKLFNVVN